MVARPADATDEVALRAALDEIAGKHGAPDVVVYNAALIRPDGPGTCRSRATWRPGR